MGYPSCKILSFPLNGFHATAINIALFPHCSIYCAQTQACSYPTAYCYWPLKLWYKDKTYCSLQQAFNTTFFPFAFYSLSLPCNGRVTLSRLLLSLLGIFGYSGMRRLLIRDKRCTSFSCCWWASHMYQLFIFIAFRWFWDSGLYRPFWYYRVALKNWQCEGFIVLEYWITHGLVYYSWVTHECWDWLLTHAHTHKPTINLDRIFSCKSMHAYTWTYTKEFCICTPNPSFSFACITWGRSFLLLTSKASGKTMSAHQ